MGLDNYPAMYPCKSQDTAIMVESNDSKLIDCKATQAAGGCPWMREINKKPGLAEGQVLGVLGTDCWYRGKYGNYLLSEVLDLGAGHDFFGNNDDCTEKSPLSCLRTAEAIDVAISKCPSPDGVWTYQEKDVTVHLKYASWYLKWAANFAGGLNCWY